MKSGKMIGLMAVGALALVVFLMYYGYSNKEIRLRNQAAAQQDSNKVIFTQVWTILHQQAGVADQYKDAFAKIYPDLIAGRYNNDKGGTFMKWIVESNPNFDTTLYRTLMASIQDQQTQFSEVQQRLRDIKREHDNIRTVAPGSWFVGGRPELQVKLVLSSETEKAFDTGKKDDIDLFPRK